MYQKSGGEVNQTAQKHFRTLFQTFRVFSEKPVSVACFHSLWTVVSSVDQFTV